MVLANSFLVPRADLPATLWLAVYHMIAHQLLPVQSWRPAGPGLILSGTLKKLLISWQRKTNICSQMEGISKGAKETYAEELATLGWWA